MNLLKRLAEEAQGHAAGTSGGTEPSHNPSSTTQAFRNQVPKPNLVTSSSIPSSSVSSVGSSDADSEYSSANLTQRRRTNIQEAEFSWKTSLSYYTRLASEHDLAKHRMLVLLYVSFVVVSSLHEVKKRRFFFSFLGLIFKVAINSCTLTLVSFVNYLLPPSEGGSPFWSSPFKNIILPFNNEIIIITGC